MSRKVRLHQAWARRAVRAELDLASLATVGPFRSVTTLAGDRDGHLGSASAGAQLSAESRASLVPEGHRVQVLIADGLSAEAINANIPDLLPRLLAALSAQGVTPGQPMLARFGRVKLAEPVAEALGAELVVVLIGERPGGDAQASRSLSAYLAYRLTDGRFEYTVVSNIYQGGLPPVRAAAVLVEWIRLILEQNAAGNRLLLRLSSQAAREGANAGAEPDEGGGGAREA